MSLPRHGLIDHRVWRFVVPQRAMLWDSDVSNQHLPNHVLQGGPGICWSELLWCSCCVSMLSTVLSPLACWPMVIAC